MVSAFGIFAGTLVHITLASLGLTAILRASPWAFNAVKYAGAAYLLFLGIRILTQRASQFEFEQPESKSQKNVFLQGVVTNVLNPKVALFFLAFLPQFVDSRNQNPALQIIFLGMIFNVGGGLVNVAVANIAGYLGNALRRHPRIARIQQQFSGWAFLGLGLRLGFSRR